MNERNIKKHVNVSDDVDAKIRELSQRHSLSQAEIMRTALALGLEALDGKAEREAREEEYERFCKALDARLDEELKVTYSAFATCSIFLPKILRKVVDDVSFDSFVNGYKHLDTVKMSEMLLHIGAGMAGGNGILSEGLVDAVDWGWDTAKQGSTNADWKRAMHMETSVHKTCGFDSHLGHQE